MLAYIFTYNILRHRIGTFLIKLKKYI